MTKTVIQRGEMLFAETGEVFALFVNGLRELPSLARGRRRFLIQLGQMGVDSIPLVLMIGLFTGMVIALQTGLVLKEGFGAEEYVGTIVGLSLVREMGPVITAFIIAGRVGSSVAAELGTMTVSEEVDALRAMGISPVRYLFAPRLAALVVMQPVLTFFSIMVGIWGGGLITSSVLHFTTEIYYSRLFQAVDFADIAHGLSKTFVFGALIATISTRMGLAARHGAAGVGRATTSAVVASLTMVLISDYLMTKFLG